MYVTLWRSVFLYALVITLLRFMGKRQIGELQPSELVTAIMISNIAAIPIENLDTPLLDGALPILALACLEVLFSAAALKSRRLRRILVGRPRRLIRSGVIDQKELSLLRWSLDDLTEQLRANGVFDLNEVSEAVVETNGTLSVYQKFSYRPATAGDLKLEPPKCDAPPALLICDGEISKDALAACGVDRAWLDKTLQQEQIAASDVFVLACDPARRYTLIPKERASR